ncbi:glycosyl transferase [Schinkia azotoformans MEV2011]|uniref:Glycosyl transferase n=1 Tax=Schinkia azotoformans MEV2011 TaxID=1348973 RepID=A0A072NPM1_SCHAZ|nr:glycosyltransferase [Schinkia azotoformans]KEF38878.1 glycosyl transferase [Schinkia azotoformans MEV2011]MEC1696781.1 glycosyltransferase [Schinkia azotoformans]MEC1725010.1 glycosyltransferase [Schinkia azotoformans]MEC1741755.1 glycosyltransferase [Schinkia azotoformans]MEC1766567.1 glycosyltransferase [Schinkia azotoformans]
METEVKYNNEVLVSISCLTYNHEKYLRQALDSMLMQKTNFPFEIIVHDDVSTDNTVEIIKEYARKYPNIVKPIIQMENQYSKKVSITHQYILPKARGKYIAYCEGDDYWTEPNKLQKQVDFLEGHPEFIATTHECWEVDENGKMLSSRYFYGYRKSGIYTINTHQKKRILFGQTATLMHRREAIELSSQEEIDKFGEIKATGDVKKAMLISLRGNTYCFEEVMSHHRRIYSGGDSWSAQLSKFNVHRFVFEECLYMQDFAKEVFGVKLDYSKHLVMFTTILLGKTVMKPSKDKWNDLLFMCSKFPSKTNLVFKITFTLIKYPFLVIKTRLTGLRHRLLYGKS